MKTPTKKSFYRYMNSIYTGYKDPKAYEYLKDIIDASEDPYMLIEYVDMTDWDEKQRLQYRYMMACQGIEHTPTQVDQYISIVEYAMDYIENM